MTIKTSVSKKDMNDFIKNLKYYKKSSLISVGMKLIWKAFFGNLFSNNDMFYLKTCGHRIIYLGIALTDDRCSFYISERGFINLCYDYFSIESLNEELLKEESKNIISSLKSLDDDYALLKRYLRFDIIYESCKSLPIARYGRMQILGDPSPININELYRAYSLLSFLNIKTDLKVEKIFNSRMQINFTDFFRSVLYMVSELRKYWRITFKESDLQIENLVKDWNINVRTCQLVSSKIAYDEYFIKEIWYKGFSNIDVTYRKYFSDPMLVKPMILERSSDCSSFLITNPKLFIPGVINFIFSHLFSNEDDEEFTKEFGSIIESHIGDVFKKIFGNDKVHKIDHDGKKADFYIEHEVCDFIIEVKTSLGGYELISLMSPVAVVETWKRLYYACIQCSNSLTKYKKIDKKVIVIILVADHVFSEFIPFHFFADTSGLLKELKIELIEFYSWNTLEYLLSTQSVLNFIKKIFEKGKIELGFSPKAIELPAHNYEYFNDICLEIKG